MEENLTSEASYRISGATAWTGRVSNPSTHPGQNGGFPTDFRQSRVSIPAILGNPENPVTQRIP
jgi:hypothetical protein